MKPMRTTWKHIRRSPYQALTAIFIMILTTFTISCFAVLVFGSSIIINYFQSVPQVVGFFKDDAKQENIDTLQNNLTQTGKIAHIKFISKKEALQKYKEQNKDDPLLLDLVTEDILPASLEVSTKKIDDLSTIADTLKSSPYISQVIYHNDVVASLSRWMNIIRIIGISLIAILVLESVFIIVSIVGFKISQKREEIEIMRLLSASNWYIRWPFILEGIFYGFIGTVGGWALASGILLYETPSLQSVFQRIPVFPFPPVFFIALLAGELLVSVVLGMFASSLAVLRYLK